MPDDLKAIVQRMIDAGEPEANIAAVIQHVSKQSTPQPIAANEPDTYWGGALKGAKEGVAGGAKGFAEGMLQSPVSFAKGIVSLLTTNPVTTVKDAVAAIERLPDAIKQAGADPEAWGKGVGDVTGQTMLGLAAPTVVRAGVRVLPQAARTVGSAVAIPAGAAIGGAVGGPVGAAVGGTVGGMVRGALQAAPSAAETAATEAATAAETLKSVLSSREPIPAAKFFELLRQVPPNERPAILAARQAAIQAGGEALPASPFRTAPAAAEAPPVAPPVAPEAAPMPVPQSAPAAPPAPVPATPAAAPMSRPAAMSAALKAFSEAQETPRPAEVSNAAALIARGATPEQALKVVIGNRPAGAVSPAAAFNATIPGTMTDDQVAAEIAARVRNRSPRR